MNFLINLFCGFSLVAHEFLSYVLYCQNRASERETEGTTMCTHIPPMCTYTGCQPVRPSIFSGDELFTSRLIVLQWMTDELMVVVLSGFTITIRNV